MGGLRGGADGERRGGGDDSLEADRGAGSGEGWEEWEGWEGWEGWEDDEDEKKAMGERSQTYNKI